MSKENKIFCTAPFTTLRIESYTPNNVGKYKQFGLMFKPGCVYDPDGTIPTLDEFLHGEEMTEHRHNLLTGTVPKRACERCWRSEQIGLDSTRLQLLKKPWASDKQKIKMLDVVFSNICNMSCFMCHPNFSSKLANERFEIGDLPSLAPITDNTEVILDTIDRLPDLESVSFIGGEFFIFKNNILILDKIIQRNLGARIITNASVLSDPLLDRLKQIKDLEIQISVDGSGTVYEFMRYPNTWDNLLLNFNTLKSNLPWAKFNFHIVVQPLNILNLHETLTLLNQQLVPVSTHNLVTPLRMSWAILTEQEKQDIISALKSNSINNKFKLTKQQKKTIEDYMLGMSKATFDQVQRDSFVDFMSKTLAYRNISKQKIQQQFDILTELGDMVISSMK
jgi:organic radical activating enzyme